LTPQPWIVSQPTSKLDLANGRGGDELARPSHALLLLSISAAFAGSLRAAADPINQPDPSIRVILQDYAGVPSRLLRKAVAVAAKTYAPAGVAIEWFDCTAVLHGQAAPPGCAGEVLPTSLYIQFFPEPMAKTVPVGRSVFGYAAPSTPRRFSNRAVLFWDRIQDHCEAFALDADALLGAALAHEIGHLLLGPGSHRSAGMMRCPWNTQDVASAARGRLSFSSPELKLLRERVERRILAAQHR
jgi:hypothetical protein